MAARRVWSAAVTAVAAVAIAGGVAACSTSGAETASQSNAAPSVGVFTKGTVRGVSENEAGDGVSTGKASDVAKFVSDSATDTDNIKSLFKALPLGGYVSDVTASDDGTVEVDLKGVDHLINGNALVTALTYDSMSAFSAVSGLQTVKLAVIMDNEPAGQANSVDLYIFNRADMEAEVGQPLTSELLSNGTWSQLKAKTVNSGDWVNGVAGAARKAGYAEENPKK